MHREMIRGRVVDIAILIVGIGWLIFLLQSPKPIEKRSYLDIEHHAGYMLRHGIYSDLTQDVIGFRALCKNEDAYPILGPAMEKLGITWNIRHFSTHPPTAFLLVSPVAWMSINSGARLWAWMMVACLAISFYCLGCNAWRAAGVALICLAWPPVSQCLGQLTAIWLLGICAAYKYLSRNPAFSGAMIAIASATKLAPAIMLALVWRRLRAFIGFAVIWIVLIGTLLVMSPSSMVNYFLASQHEMPLQFGRPDNASILARASHSFGTAGRLGAMAFLVIVASANVRQILRGDLAGWSVLSYLAVASLPILWIYSIVPLLFLARWAFGGGRMPKLFFASFILATTVLPAWNTPMILAGAIAWLGIGLAIDGLMFRRKPSA